jgi:predicted ester cyclase
MEQIFAGFPDITNTLDEIVAEDDLVAVRWTARGTHTGEFMGLAPTGKAIQLSAITMERVVDGKRVEGWAVADQLGLMRQLGAIPAPGGGH